MPRPLVIGLGLALVLLLAGLVLAVRLGGDGIPASVMGFEGLRGWLPANGFTVTRADRHLAVHPEDYDLRILPLYDTDLRKAAEETEGGAAASPHDMAQHAFNQKLEEIPSLVILPKWTTAFAASGAARPEALIGAGRLAPLLAEVGLRGARLVAPGGDLLDAAAEMPGASGRVVLYHARLFARQGWPAACKEVLGVAQGALILDCVWGGDLYDTFYLSDPDLMDNHGLSLGDNAALTVAAMRAMAGEGGALLLDPLPGETAPEGTAPASQHEQYSRNASDLVQLLRWPLAAFWAMGLLVAALALWRGAVRFGAPREAGGHRPEVSKRAAIAAQARLLRLGGADREMARDFVQAQLAGLARTLFGPQGGGGERLWSRLARRDAEQAAALRTAAEGLTEPGAALAPGEILARLQGFSDLLQKVKHGP